MADSLADLTRFGRVQQGRTEAFDSMVQFMFQGRPYVLQSLASANLNMLTVDVDRYDTSGNLFLIAAAQGNTLSLTATLTSDLLLPGRPGATGTVPELSEVPSSGTFASITLGAWIAAKRRGERIRAIVRQVFTDRSDDDLGTTFNEAEESIRQAARFQGVIDIQGWSAARPSGGENTIAFQCRIMDTPELGFWRDQATAADKLRVYERTTDPGALASGTNLVAQVLYVLIHDDDKSKVDVVYDRPMTAANSEYSVVEKAIRANIVRVTRVENPTTARHTLNLADDLDDSKLYELTISDNDDPMVSTKEGFHLPETKMDLQP